jgi:hypothetical protein
MRTPPFDPAALRDVAAPLVPGEPVLLTPEEDAYLRHYGIDFQRGASRGCDTTSAPSTRARTASPPTSGCLPRYAVLRW